MLPNGKSYRRFRYEQLLNKQAQIAYAYKGGVTLGDMEMMSEYDLNILLDSLIEIREAEADAYAKANGNVTLSNKPLRKSRFSL